MSQTSWRAQRWARPASVVAGIAVVALDVYQIATMRDSLLQPFHFIAGVLIGAVGMHRLLTIVVPQGWNA